MEAKYVRVPFDVELARKIDNKEIDGKIILSSGRKDLESSCSIAAIFEDIDYRISLNYNSGNGIHQIRCDDKGHLLWDRSIKGPNFGYIVELEIPEYLTYNDGDIISYDDGTTIGIVKDKYYKNYSGEICTKTYITLVGQSLCNPTLLIKDSRYATEKEKLKLFDSLKFSRNHKYKEFIERFFNKKSNAEMGLEIKDSISIKNDRKDDKVMMELLPWPELEEVGKVYTAGAKKYGPNKWQNLPDGYQKYKGAMLRHLTELEKGNDIDPETGCLHAAQIVWNAIAMLHCKMEEMKPHSEKIPENANDIDK